MRSPVLRKANLFTKTIPGFLVYMLIRNQHQLKLPKVSGLLSKIQYLNNGIETWVTADFEFTLLLLLLSRFSRVRLCATPQMAAHQAPPSLGFSRQEHQSGLPFPSPMRESESESEVAQLCPTCSGPMDCSPPGSSVHGIFQARVLEWLAISFFVVVEFQAFLHILDNSPFSDI